MKETLSALLKPSDTEERCGLILKDGRTIEVTNIANDRVISYEMDTQEVLPYLTRDEVVGTWHTHPYSAPDLSGEDYVSFAAWPDFAHYVIGVGGEVKCYRTKNGVLVECE